jgi:hypothetical protein
MLSHMWRPSVANRCVPRSRRPPSYGIRGGGPEEPSARGSAAYGHHMIYLDSIWVIALTGSAGLKETQGGIHSGEQVTQVGPRLRQAEGDASCQVFRLRCGNTGALQADGGETSVLQGVLSEAPPTEKVLVFLAAGDRSTAAARRSKPLTDSPERFMCDFLRQRTPRISAPKPVHGISHKSLL